MRQRGLTMHERKRASRCFSGSAAALCLCLAMAAFADDRVPLEHFARLPEYKQPKISPTGKYLAVIAPVEEQDSLVIIQLSATRISAILQFVRNAEVLDFYWANDDRVICTFGSRVPGRGALVYTAGEIYAMDADGKKKKSIFGYRSGLESRVDSRIKEAKPINAAGLVIDPLHDDRSNILIAAYPFAGRTLAEVAPTIYKVNVYTGARKKQGPVPFRSFNYLVDRAGTVRAANSFDRELNTSVLYRDADDSDLAVMVTLSAPKSDATLLDMDAAGERIYVSDSRDGKPRGVSLYDPRTGSIERLWSDDAYDVLDLVWSADEESVIGVTYYGDKLRYAFFDESDPDARLIMSIQRTFAGKEIEVMSRTRDGTKSIVRVGSASEPSDYYVFDSEKRNMNLLLGSRSWIIPAQMSPASHFEINARDGQTLRAYLTTPVNSDGGGLPLVVMPHGGPYGVRDRFDFDPEVQVLASRGYAVLQVNFRGSGGYGPAFEKAGYRHWGTDIQDDIADATRWAIDEGHADAKRICIAGASFGGYSALMSVVRYPELYRCAIGEIGVYDLPLMYEEGDIPESKLGIEYLQTAIGTDEAELIRQSPSRNADSIKASVFILYGEHDERAPPAQSSSLMEAMDRAGKPYELFVMRDEGHSFVSERTRLERYSQILRFLDKNIGKAAMTASER